MRLMGLMFTGLETNFSACLYVEWLSDKFLTSQTQTFVTVTTGSPSSLNEPHMEHNMASNYKGLYGIFYKISMKVIKSENIH